MAKQPGESRFVFRRNARTLAISFLVIAVCCFAAYFPVLSADFVSVDDQNHIYQNPHLLPISWDSLSYFWKNPYEALYIPVSYNIFSIIAEISRAAYSPGCSVQNSEFNPHVFHAANLTIHTLNCMLVFLVLRFWRSKCGFFNCRFVKKPPRGRSLCGIGKWTIDDIAPLAGALLFALHPLQTETTAWVSELRGLLAVFLGLICLLVFLRRPEKTGRRYYGSQAAALLFFALSILSKPSTAALPIIALLLDYLIFKRPLKRLALEIAPMAALALAVIVVTKNVQTTEPVPLIFRPRIIGDALAFYIVKFFAPIRLAIDYGRSPGTILKSSISCFDWILPAGALAAAFVFRRKAPWLFIAVLVSLAAIAPVSGIVTFVYQGFSTVADRYAYLPMLGASIALAGLLCARRPRFSFPPPAAFALIFILGCLTFVQCRVWKNGKTLMQNTLAIDPDSSMALNYFASDLFNSGQYQKALDMIEAAIRHYPSYPISHFNAAVALHQLGHLNDAANEYRQAIALRYNDPVHAYINLGNVYADEGRLSDASTAYARASKINPRVPTLQYDWGVVLIKQGYDYPALDCFQKEIANNPQLPNSYVDAGYVDVKLGRLDEAAVLFSKAAALDPSHPAWWTNIAFIDMRLGRKTEARESLRKALSLDPHFGPALSALAQIRGNQNIRQ